MQNREVRKLIERKLFLINSFRYTSSLNPGTGPDPILKHSVTNYFLQSVILELIVKSLFELSQKKTAPSSHNILKIFEKIDRGTCRIVEKMYEEARKRRELQFEQITDDVSFPPLREVLSSNEQIVKNFKYDAMGNSANSSVDGRFFTEALNYVESRLREL